MIPTYKCTDQRTRLKSIKGVNTAKITVSALHSFGIHIIMTIKCTINKVDIVKVLVCFHDNPVAPNKNTRVSLSIVGSF